MRAAAAVPETNGHVSPRGAQGNLWLAGRRLGVIDIGSNSIRLLCVELRDAQSWDVIAQDREMTRLAHGLNDSGLLCAEALARSAEAVVRFKAIADGLGAGVRAFATAAVREAKNRADFISLVHDRTGMDLELVSALDEGKLTHRSVSRVHDLSHGTCAVVDIGGGSMEVVFSQDGVITENTSMPLGAVRVTEAFGGADHASGPNFKKMRRWMSGQIKRHVRDHEPPPSKVVGCGGTFTTLLTLAAASRGVVVARNSPALAGLGPVSVESLRTILDGLRSMKLEQRLRVPGLPSDRADIVVAGLAAIERLLSRLGVSQVHVHPGGFREGLLLRMIDEEAAGRAQGAAGATDADRMAGVRDFARRCRYEHDHSEHVTGLAVSLYDQLRAESSLVPGIGSFPHERLLLEAAGVLHDIGTMVEYRRHHRHSQTMIRHADLPHWKIHELELVALVARYHRRALPTLDHEEFSALTPGEQALVRRLSAILRTADGLDRSHTQDVRAVRLLFGKKEVTLAAEGAGEIEINLRTADKKADLLREVLGVRVHVGSPADAAPPVQG